MIHGLCENYGWSFEEAMRRTMPQIIMLNFEAWRSYEEIKANSDSGEHHEHKQAFYHGKHVDELTTDELMGYMGGMRGTSVIS